MVLVAFRLPRVQLLQARAKQSRLLLADALEHRQRALSRAVRVKQMAAARKACLQLWRYRVEYLLHRPSARSRSCNTGALKASLHIIRRLKGTGQFSSCTKIAAVAQMSAGWGHGNPIRGQAQAVIKEEVPAL